MRGKFIKAVAFAVALSIAAALTAVCSYADGAPDIENARYAYLVHIESSTVMFTKNADQRIYPASTVKLMTGILAIEYFAGDLTRQITVTAEALDGVAGNRISLKAGEIVTVYDLLCALIVGGANDAAHVIAFEVSGSIDAFVALMNKRAKELGAVNTVYTNPTGLHDKDMYTTLADTAKIALCAYRIDPYLEISGMASYEMPVTNVSSARHIFNKNYFVSTLLDDSYYNAQIKGLNAGSTPEAGNCVVAIADNGTYSYLCIVMGASSDADEIYSYSEAQKLIDWSYTSYKYVSVLSGTELICEIPVRLSAKTDFVAVLPANGVELYLPADINVGTDVERVWNVTESTLTAPVEAGRVVGTLSLFYAGDLLAEVNLITKYHIDRSEGEYIMDRLGVLVSTRMFKASVVSAVLLGILYVLLTAIVRQRMKYRRAQKAAAKARAAAVRNRLSIGGNGNGGSSGQQGDKKNNNK